MRFNIKNYRDFISTFGNSKHTVYANLNALTQSEYYRADRTGRYISVEYGYSDAEVQFLVNIDRRGIAQLEYIGTVGCS